jgi:hypothetical protein
LLHHNRVLHLLHPAAQPSVNQEQVSVSVGSVFGHVDETNQVFSVNQLTSAVVKEKLSDVLGLKLGSTEAFEDILAPVGLTGIVG